MYIYIFFKTLAANLNKPKRNIRENNTNKELIIVPSKFQSPTKLSSFYLHRSVTGVTEQAGPFIWC